MSDPTAPAPPPFTAEEMATLRQFADNVITGRKVAVFLMKLGGWLGALAAFVYFTTETYRNGLPKP